MPKLRELLIGITVLVVLIYGGTYAYMYNKVKSGVDGLALQLMLLGNFQYDGISVSPFGSSFSINDISFTPNGFQDPLKVDSLQVEVDSLLQLMELSKRFNPTMKFPQQGKLVFAGMHVPLDTDWLRKVTDATQQEISSLTYKPKLCGGVLFIGPDELKQMGYKEFVADFRVSFYHDTTLGRMDNVIELTLRNMGRLNYKMVTNAPFNSQLMSFARMGEPKLLNNRLIYTDLSYTRKANQYCARASNMSVAEYIDARVNQSDTDYVLTWGFVPGEPIRQAYKRFLTKPDTISFSIDPSASFNLGALHLYKAQDIPAVLSLQVKVNDRAISDLGFKTIDQIEPDEAAPVTTKYSFAGGLGELGTMFNSQEQPAQVRKPKQSKKHKPHYQVVELREIGNHIGHEVKIHVANGLVREGTLEGIQGSTIYVVRTLRGGKFTMPVPYGQVIKVEALF